MDLLILQVRTPIDSPVYRGTDRATPYYCDDLGDEHPVNKAFFWYCSEGGELGLVHDLVRARELVLAYRQLRPSQHYEILAVTKEDVPPIGGKIVGFDLSAGYKYSLLGWKLEIDRDSHDLPADDEYWLIHPILRLIKEFFQPQLNSNGLFDNFAVAKFCLGCMIALQKIRSNLWENDNVRFEVVGLWEISSE
jgi:hypothetical protein